MKDIQDFWLFDGPRFEQLHRVFPEESKHEIKPELERLQLGNG
jgi:hypothetical protein